MTPTTFLGAGRMRLRACALGLLAFGLSGCALDLDLTNPNAATERTATGSLDGIIATSLGMQEQFASSILMYVRAPALVTDEWGLTLRALSSDQSLYLGTTIDPSSTVVSQPYFATYRVARSADVVLQAVPALGNIGAPFTAGLNATAKLFKAMALGMAAMQYEELPLGADFAGAAFVPRTEVFGEVIRLLESARADLDQVTDDQLAGFRTRGLSPGLDLRNTVNAMLARYYLYTNQYQLAIDAAQRVNLGTLSVLTYTTPVNPIYNYVIGLAYAAPLRSWARRAEPGDQRVGFWADTAAAPPATSIDAPLGAFRYYANQTASFPVYLPGEMLLIQAEAQARLGNLPQAVQLLNQLRARTGSATQPGANLGPLPGTVDTLDEVLAQIARERSLELYSQGLRWEDLRRLGQYIGEEPAHDFLPIPQDECLTNPNAPC